MTPHRLLSARAGPDPVHRRGMRLWTSWPESKLQNKHRKGLKGTALLPVLCSLEGRQAQRCSFSCRAANKPHLLAVCPSTEGLLWLLLPGDGGIQSTWPKIWAAFCWVLLLHVSRTRWSLTVSRFTFRCFADFFFFYKVLYFTG